MLLLLQSFIRPHALPVEYPPPKINKREEDDIDEIFLAVWMMYMRQPIGKD
jgi:hypothetical protein